MSQIEQNGYYQDEVLLDPVESSPPQQINPLLKIHQLLSGRYIWATLTGIIFAAGAVVGVMKLPAIKPVYTSTGLIQIKASIDPIIYETAFTRSLPNYDQFLESQVLIIKSQRVLMEAMDLKKDQLAKLDSSDFEMSQRLKAWDDKSWPDVKGSWGTIDPTEQLAKLSAALQVGHPSGTQQIQISFTDHDPTLASVTVKLVIASYKTIFDGEAEDFNKRMDKLASIEADLTSKISSTSASVKVALGEYGSPDFLRSVLENERNQVIFTGETIGNAESQLRSTAELVLQDAQQLYAQGNFPEANRKLNAILKVWPDLFPQTDNRAEQLRQQIAEKIGSGAVATTAPAEPLVDLTPELAAATDSVIAKLIEDRTNVQRALDHARASYGESSDIVRSAKTDLKVLQEEIDGRLAELKSKRTAGSQEDPTISIGEGNRITLAEANERLNTIRERNTQFKESLKNLQQQSDDVQKLVATLNDKQKEFNEVESERHKLAFEGASGRTEIISPGDIPTHPDKDRRIPAAAGGGIAGLGLGFGIFALIGFFDRRMRNVSDARELLDGGKRILGMLPELPDDLSDQDQMSAVAFAVHHIRTLLQLSGGEKRSSTFAVTSSSPQDGKTSLTIALGMSYAASGVKTLLIDSDIVGAGLSSRMGDLVRPRLGSILVRTGLISSEQLDIGLTQARQTGSRLGRALVTLGFIKPTDKKQALAEQAAGNRGFLDMLDGQALADCISSAGVSNLNIMSVGNIRANHVGQISIDAVRRIIAEARQQFDIVIFDTGPLLGSLEAGVVAAVADEVIVVVARGQQLSLLDQTFQRLRDLGAKLAGIVFNRARIKDMERSGYSSSLASQRFQSPVQASNGNGEHDSGGHKRLGPIARALTSSSDSEEG